jgi:hypothetical protein
MVIHIQTHLSSELEEIKRLRDQAHMNSHLPWLRWASLFCARQRMRRLRVSLGRTKSVGNKITYHPDRREEYTHAQKTQLTLVR